MFVMFTQTVTVNKIINEVNNKVILLTYEKNTL